MSERTEQRPDAVPAPRRPRARRAVRVAGLLVGVWAVVSALLLASAGWSARAGAQATSALRESASEDLGTLLGEVGGSEDDVDEEGAAASLREASSSFSEAEARISSPPLWPLRYVPVLGRQLRSVEALSGAAATTTGQAAGAVEELESILESSTATGATRFEAIERAESELVDLQAGLADLDFGPGEGLLGPLARSRQRFIEEYERVTDTLDSTLVAVSGVREFLAGPGEYLLLAANNAEMRAGSGMYLQAGELEVDEGRFGIGDLRATEELVLPAAVPILDPDVAALWGSLEPSREWRNLSLSPRFPATADLASSMWEAATGREVDGVVAVDVPAIARLLELTGPVTLPGGETVTAESVQSDLLVEQYRNYGDDREGRRDRLGQVARSVFEALNERSVSASDLLDALRELGEGRHVMMWSPHAAQQAAWEELGTAGAVPDDALMISLLNRGGNKLDPHVGIRSSIRSSSSGELRHVVVEVTVINDAPPDLPRYVSGPYPGSDLAAGEYKGILMLTMPSSAGDPSVSGGTLAALGRDGRNVVAATEVRLTPGENRTVRFEFDVPDGQESVEIQAGARVPPTSWTVGSDTFTDDGRHRLKLEDAT